MFRAPCSRNYPPCCLPLPVPPSLDSQSPSFSLLHSLRTFVLFHSATPLYYPGIYVVRDTRGQRKPIKRISTRGRKSTGKWRSCCSGIYIPFQRCPLCNSCRFLAPSNIAVNPYYALKCGKKVEKQRRLFHLANIYETMAFVLEIGHRFFI